MRSSAAAMLSSFYDMLTSDGSSADMESTDLAVDEIAARVGFAGGTSLREHLDAAIGVSPLAYRRTFRGTLAETG
jgi:transcriptional regulator GlxA family with amidase domain